MGVYVVRRVSGAESGEWSVGRRAWIIERGEKFSENSMGGAHPTRLLSGAGLVSHELH